MKPIMIMLVSEQTLPNVLLIKQMEKCSKYIFITTPKMNELNKVQHIVNAAKIKKDNTLEVIVNEESLVDINSKLSELDLPDNAKYIVNITCGTKIMSIGLFEFLKTKNSYIYYIPPNKNIYRQIFPDTQKKDNKITINLTLKEYFKAYGININSDKKPIADKALAVSFFNFTQKYYDNIKEISINYFNNNGNIRSSDKAQIEKLLKKFPPGLSKDQISGYIFGKWFEEYLYFQLQNILKPRNIMMGIEIEKNNIKNEIDLAFIYKNHLYLIEAKTNKSLKNETLNNFIYKMRAIQRDFGLFARSDIFFSSNNRKLSERGEKLGIKIHFKNNLNPMTVIPYLKRNYKID